MMVSDTDLSSVFDRIDAVCFDALGTLVEITDKQQAFRRCSKLCRRRSGVTENIALYMRTGHLQTGPSCLVSRRASSLCVQHGPYATLFICFVSVAQNGHNNDHFTHTGFGEQCYSTQQASLYAVHPVQQI